MSGINLAFWPIIVYNGTINIEKGEKSMATEWKYPIEKMKSPHSEKELLTMSFKEYWSHGIREKAPEMEIKGGK